MPATFDAVIFDLDGTLIDTESLALAASMQAFASLGVLVEDTFLHSLVGIDDATSGQTIQARYPDLDLPRLQDLMQTEFFRRIDEGLMLKPGARDLLARLSQPLAIATSSTRPSALRKLARIGMQDTFAHVITRDDVIRPKPAPDPFLLAAARLGVDPSALRGVRRQRNRGRGRPCRRNVRGAGARFSANAGPLCPSRRRRSDRGRACRGAFGLTGQDPCQSLRRRLYDGLRGWRGQVPRQPGQVRKEAAVTSPTWVVVSLSPFSPHGSGQFAWPHRWTPRASRPTLPRSESREARCPTRQRKPIRFLPANTAPRPLPIWSGKRRWCAR